ncbi:MAG: hypothetical protein COA47_10040 [Robiginitomaculum sp.]|nr:MAG: hypothetical protein COA47_10040 [Robiginitomaculum sp.]
MLDGIFWDGHGNGKKKRADFRPLAPIPKTGWVKPSGYPDLSSANIISIDIETRDPDLKTMGSSVRRDGYIAGVAVGTDDGFRSYYPIAHEVGGIMSPHNMPAKFVFKWLSRELGRKEQFKIGANLLYDLEYLEHAGVTWCGQIIDVQIAEPLIDENNFSYALDRIANKYLGESKEDEALHKWAAQSYGGKPTRTDQARNYWRCPPELVGPYAISDIDLPLRIWEHQKMIIKQQNLENVFDMESRLMPMLLKMKQKGVRVDPKMVKKLGQEWREERGILVRNLSKFVNIREEFNADDKGHLKLLWDKQDLPVVKTKKGQQSFAAAVIDASNDPFVNKVKRIRQLTKSIGTYVDGYFGKHVINGRIHCQFNQLRSDDGGTVSGRFSSSQPNLQNVTSRGEFSVLREAFLPEPGQRWWKLDYSSIEPRLCAHYGSGPSADALRALYKKNPKTDFYLIAADAANIERPPAKVVALADMYGRGLASMALALGITEKEAERIKDLMHKANPFIPALAKAASNRAKQRGYITMLSGRRRRFDRWSPKNWDIRKKYEDKNGYGSATRDSEEEILAEFGCSAQRVETHKALNSILQGGSADLIKKAMVESFEAGVYDEIGVPQLTVHDELDLSADPENPAHVEAIFEAKNHMETSYDLGVFPLVDVEMGPNWKQVEDYERN